MISYISQIAPDCPLTGAPIDAGRRTQAFDQGANWGCGIGLNLLRLLQRFNSGPKAIDWMATSLQTSTPNVVPENSGHRPFAWWVAVLLCASLTLNFVDRLVLGSVAPILRSQLHLTATQYSYIVFGFMAGMTIGQIPVGALIDRIGSRLALPAMFSGWSIANMLQSLANGVLRFTGLRFAMGIFECGNYPAGLKTIAALFSPEERALALGVFDCGSLLGSMIAPPLVVAIAARFGWRATFFLPSLLGLAWVLPWLAAARKGWIPQEAPASSSPSPSVLQLLRSSQTWGVIAMRAFGGPLSQFYWYWLPLYLVRGRGASMTVMAALASSAYLVGGAGQVASGYFSGWLIRQGASADRSRKICFTVGSVLSGVCTVAVPLVPSLHLATFLAGVGMFGVNITSNIVIAVISDVFPGPTLARVTGMTGAGEGVLNMLLTVATGAVVDRLSFTPVFVGMGTLPAAGLAALFLLVGNCRARSCEELAGGA